MDVVPAFHSREHSENATCHRTAAKKMHSPNGANGKSALEGRSKVEEKITFRRTPSKKVIKII
jgi:hypothetical protein